MYLISDHLERRASTRVMEGMAFVLADAKVADVYLSEMVYKKELKVSLHAENMYFIQSFINFVKAT